MRRSGAPSQLSGNAMKKPRFLPPAPSSSYPSAEPKPLTPKPSLCNTLQKVKYSLYFTCFFLKTFLLMMHYNIPYHVLKVQRNLPAAAVCNAEREVRPKAVPAAPVLLKALARVLNATESKENEAEEEHSDHDMGESPKDTKPSGKIQIRWQLWLLQECKV